MFIIIAIIVIVIVLVVRSKNNSAASTNTSATSNESNKSNESPKPVQQTFQNVKTLSAGESMFGVPDIHEWSDFPSRIVMKEALTLPQIQQALEDAMRSKELPVAFSHGRIEYGTALSKHYEDCIIISHQNPPVAYFDFVLTCRVTDGSSFVRVYRSGGSYYIHKINEYKSSKDETDSVINILNTVQYAMDKPDLQAWEDGYYFENIYYNEVKAVIKEVFGF